MTERHLFGPGPTNVARPILDALARPTIGHLDPEFLATMDSVSQRLRYCYQTDNPLTFVMSAPGTIGMEASLNNLLEPGDTAVIAINGVFGARMQAMVERAGANAVVVPNDWGTPVDPDAVDAALAAHPDARVLAFVHAETSTGVRSDAEALAACARRHDVLTVADCVTSLSGVPLHIDDWGIDVAYSGSQKCLACVPGLSPVTFSPRAVEHVRARTVPVRSWFADVSLLASYYETGEKDPRVPPHSTGQFPVRNRCGVAARRGRDPGLALGTPRRCGGAPVRSP